MTPEKLLDFLVSTEFYQLIDKTDEFLKIDPKVDGDKDGKITLFLDFYFRERLAGPTLQNYAKQILDFLSDEEIESLLNFIQQNLFELREKLWQEEPKKEEKETQQAPEETLEDREKRYIEIMKELIQKNTTKLPQINISKTTEKQPIESIKETSEQNQEPMQQNTNTQVIINNKKANSSQNQIIVQAKDFKTITFEPKDKHLESENVIKLQEKSTIDQTLPETTIVISKKKSEEETKDNQNETLDLSKL
jgi:archaellum component FlaF (FlaF/FlaG flagellin family)